MVPAGGSTLVVGCQRPDTSMWMWKDTCWSWDKGKKGKLIWDTAQSTCQLPSCFDHLSAWSLVLAAQPSWANYGISIHSVPRPQTPTSSHRIPSVPPLPYLPILFPSPSPLFRTLTLTQTLASSLLSFFHPTPHPCRPSPVQSVIYLRSQPSHVTTYLQFFSSFPLLQEKSKLL